RPRSAALCRGIAPSSASRCRRDPLVLRARRRGKNDAPGSVYGSNRAGTPNPTRCLAFRVVLRPIALRVARSRTIGSRRHLDALAIVRPEPKVASARSFLAPTGPAGPIAPIGREASDEEVGPRQVVPGPYRTYRTYRTHRTCREPMAVGLVPRRCAGESHL